MKVIKGQEFTVKDLRKGTFRAVALQDFDTEVDEFYPVATQEYVSGMANDWEAGEQIPCRRGISTIVLDEVSK